MPGTKYNGANFLLAVNDTDSVGSDWVVVGGQRNADIRDTTALIDFSDKESGRLGESKPGRANSQIAMELVFRDGDRGQGKLKTAYREREQVQVQRQFDSADDGNYAAVEEATGTIIEYSESEPDQEAKTVAITVQMDNDWADS